MACRHAPPAAQPTTFTLIPKPCLRWSVHPDHVAVHHRQSIMGLLDATLSRSCHQITTHRSLIMCMPTADLLGKPHHTRQVPEAPAPGPECLRNSSARPGSNSSQPAKQQAAAPAEELPLLPPRCSGGPCNPGHHAPRAAGRLCACVSTPGPSSSALVIDLHPTCTDAAEVLHVGCMSTMVSGRLLWAAMQAKMSRVSAAARDCICISMCRNLPFQVQQDPSSCMQSDIASLVWRSSAHLHVSNACSTRAVDLCAAGLRHWLINSNTNRYQVSLPTQGGSLSLVPWLAAC